MRRRLGDHEEPSRGAAQRGVELLDRGEVGRQLVRLRRRQDEINPRDLLLQGRDVLAVGKRCRPARRGAGPQGSSRSRFAISSAVEAAAQPLLPAFVPARSTACSIVSVVSTPNTTGTPVSSDTLAMPLAASAATY